MSKNICTLVMKDGTSYGLVRSGVSFRVRLGNDHAVIAPQDCQPIVIVSEKEKAEVRGILEAFAQATIFE